MGMGVNCTKLHEKNKRESECMQNWILVPEDFLTGLLHATASVFSELKKIKHAAMSCFSMVTCDKVYQE